MNQVSPATDNVPAFTVSELSQKLKRTVEDAYGHVRVRGEISRVSRPGSGHLYFDLKDEKAVLAAVCWKGVAAKLPVKPEYGLDVVCTGRLTTYPGQSKYQLVVEAMEPAGIGALMALLEQRRKQLAAEGLFDTDRKRGLPYLPEVIGVVTSPSGAVIRDILHRLRDRFPRRVLLWPVLVQGEQAAPQIAAAIDGFNRLGAGGPVPRPDLLIVARGGGSLEDLWAFNEEIVVRAAAASTIPLISAVGHETDTTLIDYAADWRAPTPTAAAEKAVPVRSELALDLADRQRRLTGALQRRLQESRTHLTGLARGLRDPATLLEPATQRLDDLSGRLGRGLAHIVQSLRVRLADAKLQPGRLRGDIDHKRSRLQASSARLGSEVRNRLALAASELDAQAKLLSSLSYQRVLERGYAVVREPDGAVITSAAAARPGAGVNLEFHDGQRGAVIAGGDRPARRKPAARAKDDDEDQGRLL